MDCSYSNLEYNEICTILKVPNSITTFGLSNSTGSYSISEYYPSLTTADLSQTKILTIQQNAFKECKKLKFVEFPSTLQSIEHSAFFNCISLQTVNFSMCLELSTISNHSFLYCGLQSVSFPANFTFLGEFAFFYSNIEVVTFNNKCTTIGQFAFSYCENLKTVIFNECQIEEIPFGLFYKCPSLIQIDIPETVTSIGSHCFAYCSLLQQVTLPNSITEIPPFCFFNCTSLGEITLPAHTQSIGNYSFFNCISLYSINKLDYLKEIGQFAFYHCSSLTSFPFPDSLEYIGYMCFRHSGLTNVQLGPSLTTIDSLIFANSENLNNCTFDESCPLTILSNWTFQSCTALQTVVLPKGLKTIAKSAFLYCESLKNIVLPDGLEDIMEYAFKNCSALTEITLPQTLKTLSYSVFQNCLNLRTVNLTSTYIDTIPSSLCRYCIRLKNFYCSSMARIETYGFCQTGLRSFDFSEVVYVGKEAFFASYITDFAFPSNCEFIDEGAISSYSVKNVTFGGKSVNEAGTIEVVDSLIIYNKEKIVGTLSYYNYEDIIIPENIIRVGVQAFFYYKANSIYFGSQIMSLGALSFQKVNVNNIIMSETSNLEDVGYKIFYNAQIEFMKFPRYCYLDSLVDSLFYFCTINKLAIPINISLINESAFNSGKINVIHLYGQTIDVINPILLDVPMLKAFIFDCNAIVNDTVAESIRNKNIKLRHACPPTLQFTPEKITKLQKNLMLILLELADSFDY